MEAAARFSFDVPDGERALGIGFYATSRPGVGGKLRVRADDFQVTEASAPVAQAQAGGKYTLATIRATNWETHRLMREMARRLGISERSIYFAGSKDKRAVTVQNIALAAPEDDVRALGLKDVEVLTTRRVDRAPKIGELSGNTFQLRLRQLDVDRHEALARAQAIVADLLAQGGFPNFFGPQRFGSVRPITHLIGKALVEGRPADAVWAYIAHPVSNEPAALAQARARVHVTRDPREALTILPASLGFERTLLEALARTPDDPLAAIDALPRTLQRLFVGAFQSLLFNQALTARAEGCHPRDARVGDVLLAARDDGMPDASERVPVVERNAARCLEATRRGDGFTSGLLPGHDTPYAGGLQGELERAVVEASGVPLDAYRLPDAPHLASYGTRRALWCTLDRVDVREGADQDGEFLELAFFLPKGSYATCLLREIMRSDLRAY